MTVKLKIYLYSPKFASKGDTCTDAVQTDIKKKSQQAAIMCPVDGIKYRITLSQHGYWILDISNSRQQVAV